MGLLGDFIKERRLSKEWSKRKLAIKANISHSEVHRIENSERENPSIRVLNSLGEALNIPKDDLLGIAGYKSDDTDIPLISRVFPALKTEKQQETARYIIDNLIENSDLGESDLDNLKKQVEMFIDYTRKKKNK